MNRIITLLLIFILAASLGHGQGTWIYGISDQGDYTHGYLTRLNYLSAEYDTLIDLNGVNIEDFSSCIDPYNGRYFIFGLIAGQQGTFHIIDLNDLSISSYNLPAVEKPEYNVFSNSIIYEEDSIFYSYSLSTQTLSTYPGTFNKIATIYDRPRTYSPFDNVYVYIYCSSGSPPFYYVVLDAFSGEVIRMAEVPFNFGHYLSPHGLVADFETGQFFAYNNERVFITDPYTGDYEVLLSIPGYYACLDHQMATYDQVNKKYIIPFVNSSYVGKVAVIDMVSFQIDTIYNQPDRWMDEHQIYCKPGNRIKLFNDSLYSVFGSQYHWFVDNFQIPGANDQILIPFVQGEYQAMTEFPAYSSLSNIIQYYFTDVGPPPGEAECKIYPNPARDGVEIELGSAIADPSSLATIYVHDLPGSAILSSVMTGSRCSLDLSGLAEGIYIVKCVTEKTSFVVGKIIVSR